VRNPTSTIALGSNPTSTIVLGSGECVDAVNFDGVVWPRAAAAAEKLWSPAAATNVTKSTVPRQTFQRLAEHRCRLVGRGVQAAPIDSSALPRLLNPGCQ
jgi:hexosaminidase